MTPPITPGTAGAHRRRRLQLLAAGGIVAALLAIGMAFTGVFASPGELNCSNASSTAAKELVNIQELTPKATPGPAGKPWRDKLQKAKDKYTVAQALATKCANGDAPPPSGDACKGVTFSPYAVAGSKRFGNPPVDLANPGSPQDVANAFVKQFKTNRWLPAVWSQGSYLVDGGISTGEVQGKAQSFVSDPNAWRATNQKLRAIMGRSSFELKRSTARYSTQEAIVNGTNQCIAPAAQDVGPPDSRGDRLLLVIHMSQVDGGRTITVVVDCDGQIWIVEPTPPRRRPTPTTAPPRGTPPATTAPPTTAPPTTVTPTPTTAPPVTTPKVQPDPCIKYPTKPGCQK